MVLRYINLTGKLKVTDGNQQANWS